MQGGRAQAGRKVAELGQGDPGLLEGFGHQRPRLLPGPALHRLQHEQHGEQPLLGAVVQVPFEAPALVLGRGSEPSPRLGQLGDPGLQRRPELRRFQFGQRDGARLGQQVRFGRAGHCGDGPAADDPDARAAGSTRPTDPDPWGQRLIAASLVALPVVTAAVLLLVPTAADERVTDSDGARSALSAASEHRLGSWIGLLLAGAPYALLIPALTAVLHATPGRGRGLVRTGHVMVGIGALALAVDNAIVAVSLRAATTPGLDHDAMVSYTVALQKEQGPLAPILWCALPLFLGVVLLAIGMLRAPALRWWHAVLVAAATVGLVAAAPDVTGAVECGLLAAMAVALVPVAPASWRRLVDGPVRPSSAPSVSHGMSRFVRVACLGRTNERSSERMVSCRRGSFSGVDAS